MTKRRRKDRTATGFAEQERLKSGATMKVSHGKYPLLDPAKGISMEELNANIRHRQMMRRLGWILFAMWSTTISVIIGTIFG